jgi:hypothetical protein
MCDEKVMGWDLPTERLPDLRFFHYGYLKHNTPERQARYACGGDQTHILDDAHVEALPWEPPL